MEIDWQRLMMGEMMAPGRPSTEANEQSMAGPSRGRQKASLPARPPLRLVESSSASSRSASQSGGSARLMPLSSSPMPSSAVSPQHSSDNNSSSNANMSQSRRKGNKARRAALNVKVLYTLDSNPRATMVAYFDQPASVDVVSLKRKKGTDGQSRSPSLFGKVTLKACLRAVCSASPELVMDNHKDFVLYAADPIESFRATQRQQSGLPRHDGASPSKTGNPSAFMVGKGFLSRALAENDDGISYVHGRVRSEYADDDDEDESSEDEENGDDVDFSSKILEVALRLKEAPLATRSEFEQRVRALQTRQEDNSESTAQTHESMLEPVAARDPAPIAVEAPLQPAATPQEQLLQLLQALQSQTQTHNEVADASNSASDASALTATSREFDTNRSDSKDAIANLLRTLNATGVAPAKSNSAHQQKPRRAQTKAKTPPAASLKRQNTTQGRPAQPSMPAADAGSPILGGLTPGYDIGYLSSGPSPAYSSASAPAQASSSRAVSGKSDKELVESSGANSARPSEKEPKPCCYNCGETSQSSWKHLELSEKKNVRFPSGSAVGAETNLKYRACNPCAVYFLKYAGNSRPEYVWQHAQKSKLKKLGEASDTAADSDAADDESPDAKSSPTRARGGGLSRTLSAACARDSERLSTKVAEKKAQNDRITEEKEDDDTSTEAVQVRIRRSAPARKTLDFESARMKDIVLDAEGNWRTKRSILENPEGRRPGRPKGIKTGEGFGRTRNEMNAKRREAQRKAAEEAAAAANVAPATSPIQRSKKKSNVKPQRPLIPASSPVRPSTSAMAAMHCKTPAGVGKLRYGAPTYLLDSSPATALQTVMDEADTDWRTLFSMSPRRSPRRNPSGVHAQVNPYASMTQTSPIQKGEPGLDSLLMSMTSSSPLTRGRVRSGNFDWAFNSSDDILTAGKLDGHSSIVTSPSSPSPSRVKPGSAKRRHNTMAMELEAGTSAEIQERAAKRQKDLEISTLAFESGDNTTGLGDEEDEGVPGSPTLGRSQRLDKKKRNGLNSSKSNSSPSTQGLAGDFSQQPSDVLNLPNDWVRSTSMRELFPTPSPNKNLIRSPSRVSWDSPTAWALRDPTPSPQKPTASSENVNTNNVTTADSTMTEAKTAPQPPNPTAPIVHRKPLPATVEDATPSDVSKCSPADDDDEEDVDEDECALEIDPNDSASMAALMEMFDDPYGLLKASGLAAGSGKAQVNVKTSGSPAKGPNASGSATRQQDNTPHIELFKSFDFAQHMNSFNENGKNGVAARVDPGIASTLLPVPNAPVQIEGKTSYVGGAHHDAQITSTQVAPDSTNNDNSFAMWFNDNKLGALWNDGNGEQANQAS